MPAISPAEVERFAESGLRDELLDSINGILKEHPRETVSICEDELRSAVDPLTRSDFLAEMEVVASLYRALGWRVICSTGDPGGDSVLCWKFNARWF